MKCHLCQWECEQCGATTHCTIYTTVKGLRAELAEGQQVVERLLKERDAVCDKLAAARKERQSLRAALIGLVGEESPSKLDEMEVLIRLATIPQEDKAKTIDAIHAIKNSAEAAKEGQ